MCPEFGVVATAAGPEIILWNLDSKEFIRKILEEKHARVRVTKSRSTVKDNSEEEMQQNLDSGGKPRSKSETFNLPDMKDSVLIGETTGGDEGNNAQKVFFDNRRERRNVAHLQISKTSGEIAVVYQVKRTCGCSWGIPLYKTSLLNRLEILIILYFLIGSFFDLTIFL